jgi:hypothetical protein
VGATVDRGEPSWVRGQIAEITAVFDGTRIAIEVTIPEVPMNAVSLLPPAQPLPRCRCGTDRTARTATPEREYTLAGAAYLLWGGTSVPRRVNFRCVYCGVVFDSSTSRAECRKYVT